MLFEEKLVYAPTRQHETSPSELGIAHEELWLETRDGERLHGWFLPGAEVDPVPPRTAGEATRPVVLLCHGNAGNVSNRLGRAVAMRDRLGVDVLLFDYRGYGKSSGRPTEPGTYEDGRAALAHLTGARALRAEAVVLFGESLGAAVATRLAAEASGRGLVLEAPFASIAAMARHLYPFAPTRLLRTRYDNVSSIAAVRMPILVIHGRRDEVVPFEQGEAVYRAAPDPKEFLDLPSAGHSDAFLVGGEPYWSAWRRLLSSSRGGG